MNAIAADLGLEDRIHLELPAARGGDQAAYGRIVQMSQNATTAIALAITRDVQASQDIAQEAYLKAWQQLGRLQNTTSFLPWLRQITRNLARDHLRARRERIVAGEAADIAIAQAADPDACPMQQIIDDETGRVAADLISDLPDESREVLLLYYREGGNSKQVAALLGLSDAAVRKRLSRARRSLREDLMARFQEFAASSAPGTAFTLLVTGGLAAFAKPAAAGTVAGVAAGGAFGAGVAGKAALGSASALGAAGVSLVFGGLTMWLCRKMVARYADTEAERRAILKLYDRWFVWGSLAGGVVGAGLGFMVGSRDMSGTWMSMAVAIALFLYNYPLLTSMPRLMNPLIARDIARDPKGGTRRALGYRLMFGTSGLILTNLGLVGVLLILWLKTA
ncbi:sigma-70 family RNA polymerase sigma factor [Luteimonas fraxinea]|uniref:RNA polymerase sigma factor n=1 Tax=Luteimonas fraxinea TaxID=2901869 RepID=A0ABS8UC92_9GAMM|nr:sigma-70 family RNA polymerase sigma factor [Luteimonas fraxinea]MCD9097122.1 sigma-70 family RNA polymerase sigma factor [Luteimonas fraxinea]MCD9126614.1 sigma-70 family RNA polymerase sigma factor [Luteimonas fraxinea]UHH09578.1 sigma-70 family RNA polymerase sigma factor [Luteimonas fraxinea]